MRRFRAGGALLLAVVGALCSCGGGATTQVQATLAPVGRTTPAALTSDAGVLAKRLPALGAGEDTAVVGHGDVVVEGPDRVSGTSALAVPGHVWYRLVLCGAPSPDTDAAPAPVTLPACGASFATDVANLGIEPEADATNGYQAADVPPDPAFAPYRSTTPPDDDPGRTVLLPADPAAGQQQYARFVLGRALMSGSTVASASAMYDDSIGGWAVNYSLTAAGARRWDEVAELAFHRYIAIDLDGQVLSAPIIEPTQSAFSSFGGKGEVPGAFDRASARSLAAVLASGPLAVPLRLLR